MTDAEANKLLDQLDRHIITIRYCERILYGIKEARGGLLVKKATIHDPASYQVIKCRLATLDRKEAFYTERLTTTRSVGIQIIENVK